MNKKGVSISFCPLIFSSDDHSILNLEDFGGTVPQEVYVVTLTRDKHESSRSEVITLSPSLVQELNVSRKSVSWNARPELKAFYMLFLHVLYVWVYFIHCDEDLII